MGSLDLALLAAVSAVCCSQAQDWPHSTTVRLGATLGLTGKLSTLSRAARQGLELLAERVNQTNTFRCLPLGSLKLQLRIADDEGDAQSASAAYLRMALGDEVDFFLGLQSAPVAEAAAEASHATGVLTMLFGAALPSVHRRGFQSVFTTGIAATDYLAHALELAQSLHARTVALVWEASALDVAVCRGAAEHATRLGLKVLVRRQLNLNSITSQVRFLKVMSPDVLVGCGSLRTVAQLVVSARAASFGLQALLLSTGSARALVRSVGAANANYVMFPTSWAPQLDLPCRVFGTARGFAEAYTERWQEPPTEHSAAAAASAIALLSAVRAACNLSTEAVRRAVLGLEVETLYGRLAWNEDGTRRGGDALTLQLQPLGEGHSAKERYTESALVPVGRLSPPLWPMPTWDRKEIEVYPCPPGEAWVSQINGSGEEMEFCKKCAAGRYRHPRSIVCEECQAGQYGAREGMSQCEPCPEGASCPAGFRPGRPNATAGYYQLPLGELMLKKCVPAELCLGANRCAGHAQGILCEQCEPGYARMRFGVSGKPCTACESYAWNIFTIALTVFLYALYIWLIVKATLSASKSIRAIHSVILKICVNYVQFAGTAFEATNFKSMAVSLLGSKAAYIVPVISLPELMQYPFASLVSLDCLLEDHGVRLYEACIMVGLFIMPVAFLLKTLVAFVRKDFLRWFPRFAPKRHRRPGPRRPLEDRVPKSNVQAEPRASEARVQSPATRRSPNAQQCCNRTPSNRALGTPASHGCSGAPGLIQEGGTRALRLPTLPFARGGGPTSPCAQGDGGCPTSPFARGGCPTSPFARGGSGCPMSPFARGSGGCPTSPFARGGGGCTPAHTASGAFASPLRLPSCRSVQFGAPSPLHRTAEMVTAVARSSIVTRFVNSSIVMSFVLHPVVVRLLVVGFECVDLDVLRQKHDLDVTCKSEEHVQWLAGSAIGLVLFGLGTPLALWVILWLHRDRLLQDDVCKRFGFLYNGFELRYYYFESVYMFRKVVILSFFTFPTMYLRTALMLFISWAFILLHVRCQPFDNRSYLCLDRLEAMNLRALTATITARLVFDIRQELNTHFFDQMAKHWTIDLMVVLLPLAFHSHFVGFALWSLFRNTVLKHLSLKADLWPERLTPLQRLLLGLEWRRQKASWCYDRGSLRINTSKLCKSELRYLFVALHDTLHRFVDGTVDMDLGVVMDTVRRALVDCRNVRKSKALRIEQLHRQEANQPGWWRTLLRWRGELSLSLSGPQKAEEEEERTCCGAVCSWFDYVLVQLQRDGWLQRRAAAELGLHDEARHRRIDGSYDFTVEEFYDSLMPIWQEIADQRHIASVPEEGPAAAISSSFSELMGPPEHVVVESSSSDSSGARVTPRLGSFNHVESLLGQSPHALLPPCPAEAVSDEAILQEASQPCQIELPTLLRQHNKLLSENLQLRSEADKLRSENERLKRRVTTEAWAPSLVLAARRAAESPALSPVERSAPQHTLPAGSAPAQKLLPEGTQPTGQAPDASPPRGSSVQLAVQQAVQQTVQQALQQAVQQPESSEADATVEEEAPVEAAPKAELKVPSITLPGVEKRLVHRSSPSSYLSGSSFGAETFGARGRMIAGRSQSPAVDASSLLAWSGAMRPTDPAKWPQVQHSCEFMRAARPADPSAWRVQVDAL